MIDFWGYSGQEVVGALMGLGLVYKGITDRLLKRTKPIKAPRCAIHKDWVALEFDKIHMKLDALLRESRKD